MPVKIGRTRTMSWRLIAVVAAPGYVLAMNQFRPSTVVPDACLPTSGPSASHEVAGQQAYAAAREIV
jgi:hypothetical protein